MALNYAPWVPEVAIPANTPTYLFKIGSYDFRVYSLMILLGILCSVLTIVFFWMRAKYKIEILLTFILITIPMSIIGARLGYVFEALIYEDHPFQNSHWFAIWDGGLSIQGGIILATVADLIYGYTKRKYIDMRKVASYIIPAILIGQFIGRWGNYANHEVYGKIDWSGQSVLIWGKQIARNMFLTDSTSDLLLGPGIGAYRVPLFLYEGIATLTGYALIVWVFNLFGLFKPGSTAGMYLFYYGLVRTIMEPMREDAYELYSVTSIVFMAFGIAAILYFQVFSRVEYIKEKKKYYFEYKMKYAQEYLIWVQVSSFTNMAKKTIAFLKSQNFKKLSKKQN